MFSRSKKQHTPAAMRNIGFSAIRLYGLGFLASAAWILLFTFWAMSTNVSMIKTIVSHEGILITDTERETLMADNDALIKKYTLASKQQRRNKTIFSINDLTKAELEEWEKGKQQVKDAGYNINDYFSIVERQRWLKNGDLDYAFEASELGKNTNLYFKAAKLARLENELSEHDLRVANGRPEAPEQNLAYKQASYDNFIKRAEGERLKLVGDIEEMKQDQSYIYNRFFYKQNGFNKDIVTKIKLASVDQINALRVTLLLGACIILFMYILLGHRFSIIKTPAFMGKHFYTYSLPFIAAYALTFINSKGSVFSSLWLAFWLFIPPIIFMTFPVLKLVFVEYFKEHPLYRRWFVLGRGGEAARMAGIKEFSEKELPNYFESGKLKFKEKSSIYLGKTLFEDDIKIGGREVGITNEQHMATFALTGAGKSRDAVWNTLLNYSGGTLVFDPKGEHFRVTSKRRAEAAPVHLLDPYGSVSDIAKTEYWNPLSEIDINSPSARDELRNMAEASIYMDKGESGSGGFFRENAQLIYRGFLAYVLDQMPENDRHLGTVYDLMATGEPEGKFASKRSWDTLIAEMMLCDAVAGAPRDAASLLERVGERERGSYISTIVRGIDWVNSPAIREVISKPSSFSIRDAKSKEASIYLVLPEKFITPQIRFIRTFYSMAFGYCNNFETPQPKGSKRRVLFLFDEFNKLGEFRPALDAILTQRSSFLKCWFIQQNVNQLKSTYDNVDDFLSSCDKQFFGIDATDTTAIEMIEKALGSYTITTRNDKGDIANTNETHALMSRSEIAEFLDKDQPTQIVIPLGGKPLKLKKTRYYQNFNSSQYGKHDF